MNKIEARTRLFQLLAMGFAHPKADVHRLLASGEYELALAQVGAHALGLEPALPPVLPGLADFEADFIRLFQVGKRGMPQVSLNAADYEGLVEGENRPEFLLRYSGWYRHFGLKVSEDDGAGELPDHLVCQLEFMTWLSHLETESTDKPALLQGYQRAQLDFLQRQLLPFLEALVTALQSTEQSGVVPFYRALAVVALESGERLLEQLADVVPIMAEQLTGTDTIDAVNLWG